MKLDFNKIEMKNSPMKRLEVSKGDEAETYKSKFEFNALKDELNSSYYYNDFEFEEFDPIDETLAITPNGNIYSDFINLYNDNPSDLKVYELEKLIKNEFNSKFGVIYSLDIDDSAKNLNYILSKSNRVLDILVQCFAMFIINIMKRKAYILKDKNVELSHIKLASGLNSKFQDVEMTKMCYEIINDLKNKRSKFKLSDGIIKLINKSTISPFEKVTLLYIIEHSNIFNLIDLICFLTNSTLDEFYLTLSLDIMKRFKK